jgi:hypothetical protein
MALEVLRGQRAVGSPAFELPVRREPEREISLFLKTGHLPVARFAIGARAVRKVLPLFHARG